MAREAARDDASKTKWSRRDLLAGAAGAFGVFATQSLHAAGKRETAWLALGPQELEEGWIEEPRGCVPCAS
jgi:hypothetical protein